jgi:hypothetical protein
MALRRWQKARLNAAPMNSEAAEAAAREGQQA